MTFTRSLNLPKCARIMIVAASTLLTVDAAMAAGLPDGTCSGSGMTVTVIGGSIVAYQYQGRSYAVTPKGGSVYKIGSAGALRVTSVKATSFKGIMSLRGYETPATFNCK